MLYFLAAAGTRRRAAQRRAEQACELLATRIRVRKLSRAGMRSGYGGVRGCVAHELSYRVMFFLFAVPLANSGSKTEAVVLMCGCWCVGGGCAGSVLYSSEMCCRWNLSVKALYEKWQGVGASEPASNRLTGYGDAPCTISKSSWGMVGNTNVWRAWASRRVAD
jgi:hypothetical protein